MSVAVAIIEDRRLRVLKSIQEMGDGRLSEIILIRAMKAEGMPADFDTVRADLGWLERQGCLRIEKIPTDTSEQIWVGELTSTGVRVAEGMQTVTGIARSLAR
jgi:hypothetical protein